MFRQVVRLDGLLLFDCGDAATFKLKGERPVKTLTGELVNQFDNSIHIVISGSRGNRTLCTGVEERRGGRTRHRKRLRSEVVGFPRPLLPDTEVPV